MPLIVPLRPGNGAYQTRQSVDGVELVFDVTWQERTQSWSIAILDSAEAPLLGPRHVATGWALNLRQLGDPRLPDVAFVVVRVGDSDADPGLDELGAAVQLWVYTRDELDELAPQTPDPVVRVVIS
jgi:hypothetical protein